VGHGGRGEGALTRGMDFPAVGAPLRVEKALGGSDFRRLAFETRVELHGSVSRMGGAGGFGQYLPEPQWGLASSPRVVWAAGSCDRTGSGPLVAREERQRIIRHEACGEVRRQRRNRVRDGAAS